MKVAWVSLYDAEDPRAYDGRGYHAPLCLKNQSVSMEFLGPLQTPGILKAWRQLRTSRHRLLHDNRFIRPADRRWFSPENIPAVVKDYARQIAGRLAKDRTVEVVCSGVNPLVQPLSYLECRQPIAIWVDTTFASAIDFYPDFFRTRLCRESIRDMMANERALFKRCKLAIFASEWGAQSAVGHYQYDASRTRVVPFGANLECSRTTDDIGQLVSARPMDRCRLLFVGLEWHRKGGDIAYQVAKELNRAGMPTELTVVGCQPELDEPMPDYVRPLGRVNNATEEGRDLLSRLFAESHFFIMPSRAESFGHVFCEASSFGVPSLATDVGGVPSAVRNGLNGRTFARDAEPHAYCAFILEQMSQLSRYRDLCLSSFHEYESRLNWRVAGQAVKRLLEELRD